MRGAWKTTAEIRTLWVKLIIDVDRTDSEEYTWTMEGERKNKAEAGGDGAGNAYQWAFNRFIVL
jgi:hypothetical protein